MNRRTFRAMVTDASGQNIIGERETFAWNSAIRATEGILREYARDRFTVCHGDAPTVMGERDDPDRIYRRIWRESSGREFHALVWEVQDKPKLTALLAEASIFSGRGEADTPEG